MGSTLLWWRFMATRASMRHPELVDAPVVGIAEAALLLACTLAHQFSVVTVIPRIVPMLRDLVRRYGLESRCASVGSSGLSVLDIRVDQEQAGEAIRGWRRSPLGAPAWAWRRR
jgi:Asp/Glu/hydantoin racemase